jgi:hypothetical protein
MFTEKGTDPGNFGDVAQFIAVCRSVKTSYKMRISVRIFKSCSRPQETLIHADSLTSPLPFQY